MPKIDESLISLRRVTYKRSQGGEFPCTYVKAGVLIHIISERSLQRDGASLLNDVEIVQGFVAIEGPSGQKIVAEIIL